VLIAAREDREGPDGPAPSGFRYLIMTFGAQPARPPFRPITDDDAYRVGTT
jgi:hypothetical protein